MSGASHFFLATSQTTRPIGGAARSGRWFVARCGDNAAVMGVANVICGAGAAEIAAKGQQGLQRQPRGRRQRARGVDHSRQEGSGDRLPTRRGRGRSYSPLGPPHIGARGASCCRKHGRRERFRGTTNERESASAA
jgi:hypothetical protein